MKAELLARFHSGYEQHEGGCWEWIRSKDTHGYGQFWAKERPSMRMAHKWAWLIHIKEEVPKGLFVCHTCDNRACVNPGHLYLGTNADNMADKRARQRQPRGRAATLSTYQRKLSEEDARGILCDARPATEVAAELGVSAATVRQIKSGRRWAWLKADGNPMGSSEQT